MLCIPAIWFIVLGCIWFHALTNSERESPDDKEDMQFLANCDLTRRYLDVE